MNDFPYIAIINHILSQKNITISSFDEIANGITLPQIVQILTSKEVPRVVHSNKLNVFQKAANNNAVYDFYVKNYNQKFQNSKVDFTNKNDVKRFIDAIFNDLYVNLTLLRKQRNKLSKIVMNI